MTFSTHCISCTRGMGDYIIGIFEPSFLSFLSPYYLSLRYVSCLKTTLRSWLHTLCLTAHTWAILEIGWRLFLGVYWMRSWDHGLHWSIPFLSVMDFMRWCDIHWGIPCSSMIDFWVDDLYWGIVFLLMMDYWDETLHWGITSSPLHLDYDGLGVMWWPYTGA